MHTHTYTYIFIVLPTSSIKYSMEEILFIQCIIDSHLYRKAETRRMEALNIQ